MGIKGCWTCRRRKVRCDGREPACGNCLKSQRGCQGYGVQLSWPRDDDKRRCKVARDGSRTAKYQRFVRFLNVFQRDIILAQTLEDRGDIGTAFLIAAANSRTRNILPGRSLRLFRTSATNSHLIEFFLKSKYMLLAPIVNMALTDYILRIALSDPSPASNLVFHTILAIASLRLQGHSRSFNHKSRVISMLRESITHLDRLSVIKNLTATMVLYQYELSHTTIPSPDWALHLCGAKHLVDAASVANVIRHDEDSILLDWVYYHEVSSEFSLRHWRIPRQIGRVCEQEPRARPPQRASSMALISGRATSFNDALGLFTTLCRSTATDAGKALLQDGTEDKTEIQSLVGSIYDSIGEYGPCYDGSATHFNRREMITLLHQISALLYYHRTVLDAAETFQHRRLVREGMLLLKTLGSCESALPLFILACEASDDDQRLDILEVFDRTQADGDQRSNHIAAIRDMTVAVWNQKDLNVGNNVSHSEILDAVISTSGFLPLFA